jgi:hypothetical protein
VDKFWNFVGGGVKILLGFLAENDQLLAKLAVAALILLSLAGLVDGYRRGWGFEDTVEEMLGRGIAYPVCFSIGAALTAGIIFGFVWVVF